MGSEQGEGFKTRAIGVVQVLAGIGLVILLEAGGPHGQKLTVGLSMVGPMLIWLGFGLVLVPVDLKMFEEMENGGDLGKILGRLPLFWKVWLPLALVVMFAGMIYGGLLTL